MASLIPTYRLLFFLAFASSTYAYSNNLWHKDFDTFDKWRIIQENEDCTKAYQALNQQRNNSMTTALIDCTYTIAFCFPAIQHIRIHTHIHSSLYDATH